MVALMKPNNRIVDTIIHGDALEVLRTLDACSVDAIVTDPPSAIHFMGKEWDSDKGGRTEWIGWLCGVMREVLRVLKPGGHALIWALPRTSHWTATAIEDAGFEIRDVLTHLFGSGFPKSHNISAAIDKHLGAERTEKEWYDRYHDGGTRTEQPSSANIAISNHAHTNMHTLPSTPEARQHAGTGTALKPANEHWILARKPLSESSIAANVLKWGTGGLNIDACRVGTQAYTQEQWTQKGLSRVTGNSYGEHKGSDTPVPQGRFPSNLLLSHSLFCTPLGTHKVVKGHASGYNWELSNNDNPTHVTKNIKSGVHYGGEEVEAWDCTEDCPIRLLDEQSGIRPSGYRKNPSVHGNAFFGNGREDHIAGERGYYDQGGASRYFTQFCYTAKASRAERNRGCEGLPEKEAKSIRRLGMLADLRMESEQVRQPESNTHPTVKPLALMSWLCRLITPPGGTVLDCFAGSGSTLCAAIYEGFHFIGIEQEASYVEIAMARVRHAWEVQP